MRATVFEDFIVSFGGDTEIGSLPKGVGLERLRWDGQKLIDLDKIEAIWVRCRAGVFELHVIEVPGSQVITMRYADRKRLYVENGVIGIRTAEEMEALEQAEADRITQNSTLKTEALAFASGLTYTQIDVHIEAVFGGLSPAQKTSLKRLYKTVLCLAKTHLRT